MKTKLILLLCTLVAVRLVAETLQTDTAVFAQTDPKSAVLTKLKAGATVTVVGEAPPGWRRIEVAGPFEAYVNNHDITKDLQVREGANILSAPRKDAPVLTVATPGDKTDITGLRGDYCQIKLIKNLQGFIAVGEMANTPAPADVATLPTAPEVATPPPATPAVAATSSPAPDASPAPEASVAPGRPAPPAVNPSDSPRMFAGRLVLARRAFINPNPLYDYQLMDASGRRFAYIDTRRLLTTDKMETFLDRDITLTGTVRNTVDGKNLVIAVESMQLRK